MDEAQVAETIEKIRQLEGAEGHIVQWLYAALNTLDSKASALLRFNGLFIALLAGFVTLWVESTTIQKLPVLFVQAAAIILVVLLISSLFCFYIVQVSWSFLGRVELTKDAAGARKCDYRREQVRLTEVVASRTRAYWIAVSLSTIAITAIVGATMLALIGQP